MWAKEDIEMLYEMEHNRLIPKTLIHMFLLQMRSKMNNIIDVFEDSNREYSEMQTFLIIYCRDKEYLSDMVVKFNSIMNLRRSILTYIEEMNVIDNRLWMLSQRTRNINKKGS